MKKSYDDMTHIYGTVSYTHLDVYKRQGETPVPIPNTTVKT